MAAFNESNTIEAYLCDLLSGPTKSIPANKGLDWHRIASAHIPRPPQEVSVEPNAHMASVFLSSRWM